MHRNEILIFGDEDDLNLDVRGESGVTSICEDICFITDEEK